MALTDRPQIGSPPGPDGQGPLSPAPRPYNWRATAWLVVGIAVVVVAMGVFMRVIPTPFTQPGPTASPAIARPTAQPALATARATAAPTTAALAPTAAPLAAPTLVPTESVRNQPATVAPAVQLTVAPTRIPALAAQPTAVPAVIPTTQPAIAEATSAGEATAVQQPTATDVDPALQAEILDGYNHYWQVLSDALFNLDSTNLDQVMYGQQLLAVQIYINQLKGEGRAGRMDVEHSIQLVHVEPGNAELRDQVVDNTIFVDPVTKEPLVPDEQATRPEGTDPTTYYLMKIDGVWKVINEE